MKKTTTVYCECDAPLIRTGEFNKEYCGICGKDINTIKLNK